MKRSQPSQTEQTHLLTVHDGAALRCSAGVNLGEPFRLGPHLCLGDTYRLDPGAEPVQIALTSTGTPPTLTLAKPLGPLPAGLPVTPGPRLTLMSRAAQIFTIRLLDVADHLLILPIGRFDLTAPLDLICMDRDRSPLPESDPTTLAFAPGTRITLSDGTLRPVEQLVRGDLVLTRDGRAQPLRALLSENGPALGSAARVIIRDGAFANDRELLVSAGHRLLLPGARGDLDRDAPDRVLPAARLVNGLTVTQDQGGQAEWLHLLLDRHEFIFAEGIPCESLCLTRAARAGLSPDLARQLAHAAPGLVHEPHPLTLQAVPHGPPPSALPRQHALRLV